MNLEELQALVAVVDHGSVLAAADALGLARTTLRRRLDDLEARAGVPLLHRLPSGAVPTEGGQLLVDQGRRMLRDADAVLASVRELGRSPSGTVRVVAPPGMPPHLMVPILLGLRARLPGLDLDHRYDARPLPVLLSDADVVVQWGGARLDGPWIAFVLHRLPERLVASRDYALRRGLPTSLAELADHPVFGWIPPDREARDLPLEGGGTYTCALASASHDAHFVRQLALGGHGLAMVPEALLPDPGFPDDALVPVLPGVVGRLLSMWVVVPEAVSRVPKVRVLVDVLREVADGMPEASGEGG